MVYTILDDWLAGGGWIDAIDKAHVISGSTAESFLEA